MNRPVVTVGLAALALTLTTGCSESSAQAAPRMPWFAKQHSPAGALSFVQHYYATIDHAYATGESDLDEMSISGCVPCLVAKTDSRAGDPSTPTSEPREKIKITEMKVVVNTKEGAAVDFHVEQPKGIDTNPGSNPIAF